MSAIHGRGAREAGQARCLVHYDRPSPGCRSRSATTRRSSNPTRRCPKSRHRTPRKSGRERTLALAKRENMTVRQVAQRLGGHGGLAMLGTPKMIADQMEEWIESRASDGFTLQFPYLPMGARRRDRARGARAAAPRAVPRRVRGRDLARESRPAAAREPVLPAKPN